MKTSNKALYIILLVASFLLIGISLFFDTTNKLFTICSSVGCSGIVSVIVAWLLELSNEKIQSDRNKEIVDCLLDGYDAKIRVEMQRALTNCAVHQDFDLNKCYSVTEIQAMLEKLDCSHVYFKGLPDMVEKSLENVTPATLLSFEQNDNGIKLHTLFVELRSTVSTVKWFVDQDETNELIKILGIQIYSLIQQINDLRKIEMSYAIHEDTKNYLMRIREKSIKGEAVE